MKFEIDIKRKHLLYTVFLVAVVGGTGLVVGFGGNDANVMGHSAWEYLCNDCLTSGNISTGAVTSDEILDKTITDDDISSTANINGSKIDESKLDGYAPNLNCSNADTVGGKDADDLAGGGSITTYKISVKGHMDGPTCKSKKKTWTCPSGNISLINAPGPVYVEPSKPSNGDACPYSVSEGTITINALVSWYDGWTWGQSRGVATVYTPANARPSCNALSL
jgi:hypothetical protein